MIKKTHYWTAFLFNNDLPESDLHCTHKFLGCLSGDQVLQVRNFLSEYFNGAYPVLGFKALFDKETYFGPEADIRVLTLGSRNQDMFLPALREALSNYRKDDFPYTPHISTRIESAISCYFDRYALFRTENGKSIIIHQWGLNPKPAPPLKVNRFDYVEYDEKAVGDQVDFKAAFQLIEKMSSEILQSPRAKALVLTKIEEAYMWVGKAIRDDQIARNGSAPLQETRKDG